MVLVLVFSLFLLPLASFATAVTSPCLLEQAEPQESKTELRQTLKNKLTDIEKNDAKALYSLVLWAGRKGLKLSVPRILRMVIEADTDHVEAREKLGYARFKDTWIRKKDLVRIAKKAKEAEYKKLGMIKINGDWVKKEDAAYARLGFAYVDKTWVRKSDQAKIRAGQVLHPRSGVWIDEKELDKAKQGLFRHQEKWVPLAKADRGHKNWINPWVLQRNDFVLTTDYGFAKAQEILNEAETALAFFKQVFYSSSLPLPRRLQLRVFSSREDYTDFGAANDESGFSNYGAFYSPRHDSQPVAILYGAEKSWGPYFLKYGVGLGASLMLLGSNDLPFTHWIHSGLGSYIEHFTNKAHCQYFGRQYQPKGGVRNLKSFWKSFNISGSQDDDANQWNMYQAGFVIAYTKNVINKPVRKAWENLKLAATSGNKKKIRTAVKQFEKKLQNAQKDIKDYLKNILQG